METSNHLTLRETFSLRRRLDIHLIFNTILTQQIAQEKQDLMLRYLNFRVITYKYDEEHSKIRKC